MEAMLKKLKYQKGYHQEKKEKNEFYLLNLNYETTVFFYFFFFYLNYETNYFFFFLFILNYKTNYFFQSFMLYIKVNLKTNLSDKRQYHFTVKVSTTKSEQVYNNFKMKIL